MPNKVNAVAGDCLCGIAALFGFFDCKPLRDAPENSGLLNRPLKDGDEVTIPDITVEDHSKAVDTKHTFKLKTSPPMNIRFVHGSPDLPYRDDFTVPELHISNFVTNLAGTTGLANLPTGYGFHADGHADPDTFKVEVWDPKGGGSVNVKLEALKPKYKKDPSTGKMIVDGYEEFADAKRKINALVCNVVSSTTKNTFRSKYMRLVVDEEDRDNAGVTDQVLWISDMADGLGTDQPNDNDTLEILDQMVRATYEVKRCTGSPKCKVTAVAPVGGGNRLRVRLHFYLFRKTPGGAQSPHNVAIDDVKKHLRRRTFKWYRRAFSQADVAPVLSSLNVLDPPAENMLCLSHFTGRSAKAGSTISFRITTATRDDPFSVTTDAEETPVAVGFRIVNNLPVGYRGEYLTGTRPTSALNHSCDVIIKAANGERVTLLDVQITGPREGLLMRVSDPGMTIAVPRVDLMNVISDDAAFDGSTAFQTIDFKRILREVPVTDDAMHCIVVGEFSTKGLRGIAFPPCMGAKAEFRPELPFRSATIMAYRSSSGGVLDNGDTLPFTSPHESAHTLCDLVHTAQGSNHERNQLLGSGTSVNNSVTATKRLCDGPFTVTMQRNLTTTFVTVTVKLAEVMRVNGAAKMEPW
jgi:hypothetical protein